MLWVYFMKQRLQTKKKLWWLDGSCLGPDGQVVPTGLLTYVISQIGYNRLVEFGSCMQIRKT